jgi:hypothetical protein
MHSQALIHSGWKIIFSKKAASYALLKDVAFSLINGLFTASKVDGAL